MDNAVAATRRGIEMGLHERVWALVDAVHPLLIRASDHPARLALWTEAARAAAALGDDRRRARALRWVSNSHRISGALDQALESAAEAVRIAEEAGDQGELAQSLTAHGEALRDQYRFEEATAALRQALELFIEVGDTDEEIGVRNALGALYNQSWQCELAIPVLEQALELLPAGEEHRRAWTLLELSTAYRLTGRRDEGAAFLAMALRQARRIGDDFALGWALQSQGWQASEARWYDEAAGHMAEALAVFERIRHGTGIGSAYEATGLVTAAAGRHADAIAHFDAAIAQFDRLRDPQRAGRSRLRRALSLAHTGRTDEARTAWADGEERVGGVDLPEAADIRQQLRERLGDRPAG
jgi:tetratricopeptide (TPR) repeat protein